MRVIPIEFPCLAVERTRLKIAVVDAQHRHDLGIVARDEDLIRSREILVAQRLSFTWTPSSRRSRITRWRVTLFRKVPFGTGVCTTPSFAMKTLDVPVSATFPRASHTRALSNPLAIASCITRALFG